MIKLQRPNCPYPKGLEDGNYKHPRNKSALGDAANDKCMYCESKISHIDHAHVEHIKPKSQNKYPELEFDWGNLGYACPKCNNNKGDKYDEATPYLDPYTDDPREHLVALGSMLFVKNGSERGELTILDIQLNRPDLVEQRYSRISEINTAITACFRTSNESLRQAALAELLNESNADKEYSMAVESAFAAHGLGA